MSRDTSEEARRLQVSLLRDAGPVRRVRLALSLSAAVMDLSRRGIARAHPDWTEEERDFEFVRRHYGEELAAAVRRHLRERR